VFDFSGRLVRVLLQSFQSAGSHELTWDGTDGSGRRIPAGIYFVKLDTERNSRIQRLAVVL
jgi:flagellar hook assembly protein FlgD